MARRKDYVINRKLVPSTRGGVEVSGTMVFRPARLNTVLTAAIAQAVGEQMTLMMKNEARLAISRPSNVRHITGQSDGRLVRSIGWRPTNVKGEPVQLTSPDLESIEVGAGIATTHLPYYSYVERGTGIFTSKVYGGPTDPSEGKYVPKWIIVKDDGVKYDKDGKPYTGDPIYHKIYEPGAGRTTAEKLFGPLTRTTGPKRMEELFGKNWNEARRMALINFGKKNTMFVQWAAAGGNIIDNTLSESEIRRLLYQFNNEAVLKGYAPLTDSNEPGGWNGVLVVHHIKPRAHYKDVSDSNVQSNLMVVFDTQHIHEERKSTAIHGQSPIHPRNYEQWIKELQKFSTGGALGRTRASEFDKKYALAVQQYHRGLIDPHKPSAFPSKTLGLGRRLKKDNPRAGMWPGSIARKFAYNTRDQLTRQKKSLAGGFIEGVRRRHRVRV